ncbi:MAG TPA: T9SS type A sorting domain-containing protein [Ignavibacteria bacterium]|nr:T9SS type A sorting domain-containing protein [Ignavibacteria bacterium]
MKNIFSILAALVILAGYTTEVSAYSSGLAGRTLKTTTSGCGSCHTFGTSTAISFSGPDTVHPGATEQYTITISGTNSGMIGVDIAAKSGILGLAGGDTYLKLSGTELVQNTGITASPVTITFSYTAPSAVGVDTLYATAAKGYSGKWNWAPNKGIVIKNPSSVENISTVANLFSLKQNYPNPFNPSTNIEFSIAKQSNVTVKVYNLNGKEVAALVSGIYGEGIYKINWNAGELASGVYFYRIQAGNFTETKRLTLIK